MNFSWTTHSQQRTRKRYKVSSLGVDVDAYKEMDPSTIPYSIGQIFKIHTKIRGSNEEIKLICTRRSNRRIKVITVLYPHEVYQEILKSSA